MSYLHISNLYSDQTILLFKRVWALEKIHGSSAHISYHSGDNSRLMYHAGGEKAARFQMLFDDAALRQKLADYNAESIVIFGEVYGGKQQGMSATYGKDLKFVAFDVKINNLWLSVPEAADIVKNLGLEFVYYEEVSTDLEELNKQRDADSVQAVRNGMGAGHKREGVVLRPLIEMTLNSGERIIAKHKRDEFRETASPRVVDDPQKLVVLQEAEAIAKEWVTAMRLQHVLDKIPDYNISMTGTVIAAMIEDVLREGQKELVDSKEARKAISQRTAIMFKEFLKKGIDK